MSRPLVLLVALALASCKVTAIKPLEFYLLKTWRATHLTLYKNHLFQYEEQFPYYFLKEKPLDSVFFVTTGTWEKHGDKFVLNSFKKPANNTGEVRNIDTIPNKQGLSTFTFYSLTGETISYYRVDFKKDSIAYIIHNKIKDFGIDLAKHDSLIFYFDGYKPFVFRKKQDIPQHYKITLAPYYKTGYFINKEFIKRAGELIADDKIFIKPAS